MPTPEKRRGAHILRAGSSHLPRHGPGSTGSTAAAPNANSTDTGSMPAVPPRAAMANLGSGNTDEPLEVGTGGAPPTVERREKDGEKDSKDSIGSASRSSSSAPAAAAKDKKHRDRDAAQMREKDERIAALKAELATMEHEFQRELNKLSQAESETSTFWQSKHSALNQQFLRTDTELRLLRAEIEVREGEREELRQGWEVLRRELRERDDEIRSLRGQVRGLKEFVSTSTRTDGQTSDEVFGDALARLGNGLQNWVIVNFRKAKLDLSALDEATLAELNDLVPMYEELVHTAKVHLLQSIVSRILVETVFSAYYVGLSDEQTTHFRQMEQLLCSFATSDESVNQWRSSTLALIRREAPDTLRDETAAFAESVIARIGRLLDALTGSSSTTSSKTEGRDSALRVLVNNSIELARMLVVQKAVLRVYMPEILPHQRVPFETETMDDIGGEDEDALSQRDICCVVFPGIIKRGDENGGHMQYRNVIAKAKVLCSPEE
ncbi:hypothetical protein HJFPF1_07954 [Paramyrothecium foliicola]|nr:hypothetical protein HJFPF1_07954 [Paramyrothecium foliicola]